MQIKFWPCFFLDLLHFYFLFWCKIFLVCLYLSCQSYDLHVLKLTKVKDWTVMKIVHWKSPWTSLINRFLATQMNLIQWPPWTPSKLWRLVKCNNYVFLIVKNISWTVKSTLTSVYSVGLSPMRPGFDSQLGIWSQCRKWEGCVLVWATLHPWVGTLSPWPSQLST